MHREPRRASAPAHQCCCCARTENRRDSKDIDHGPICQSLQLGISASIPLLCIWAMTACGIKVQTGEKLTAAAVVLDTSEPALLEHRCDQLGGLATEIIGDGGQVVDFLVYGLGDARTGDEPRPIIAEWTRFSPPPTQLYNAADPKIDRFVSELVARCTDSIQQAERTPLYRAEARALSAVAARCAELATDGSTCRPILATASDFLENQEAGLSMAIRAKKPDLSAIKKLDAIAVELRLCGQSERVGAEAVMALDRLEAAWSVAFGKPAQIAPTCPRFEVVP